jgi:hypothetical protein
MGIHSEKALTHKNWGSVTMEAKENRYWEELVLIHTNYISDLKIVSSKSWCFSVVQGLLYNRFGLGRGMGK